MSDHHPYSPSKLPALLACSCYVSNGESSEAADRGTAQHKALELLLHGDKDALAGLEAGEDTQVLWAYDWIRGNTTDRRLVEEKVQIFNDEFEMLTEGTIDVLDPPAGDGIVLVVDYKSGDRRDYSLQLAAYALGAMQRYGAERARCVILYGRSRRVDQAVITYPDAMADVTDVLGAAKASDRQPAPCGYCKWCGAAATCPALAQSVEKLVGPERSLVTLDLSAITPVIATQLLEVCDYAEAQTAAIRKRVRQMMIDEGQRVPGYTVKERAGKVEVTDVTGLYQATGLEPDKFLAACAVQSSRLSDALVLGGKAETKTAAMKLAKKLLEQYGERKASAKIIQKEKETDAAIDG